MNERIKELARQSGALPTQDCGVPQWYIDEDEFEKFAELIVRECANRATWAQDTSAADIGGEVLKHFGVEE